MQALNINNSGRRRNLGGGREGLESSAFFSPCGARMRRLMHRATGIYRVTRPLERFPGRGARGESSNGRINTLYGQTRTQRLWPGLSGAYPSAHGEGAALERIFRFHGVREANLSRWTPGCLPVAPLGPSGGPLLCPAHRLPTIPGCSSHSEERNFTEHWKCHTRRLAICRAIN